MEKQKQHVNILRKCPSIYHKIGNHTKENLIALKVQTLGDLFKTITVLENTDATFGTMSLGFAKFP